MFIFIDKKLANTQHIYLTGQDFPEQYLNLHQS